MSSNNHKDFWEKIKCLDPRKDTSVHIEFIDSNGVTINNESLVL